MCSPGAPAPRSLLSRRCRRRQRKEPAPDSRGICLPLAALHLLISWPRGCKAAMLAATRQPQAHGPIAAGRSAGLALRCMARAAPGRKPTSRGVAAATGGANAANAAGAFDDADQPWWGRQQPQYPSPSQVHMNANRALSAQHGSSTGCALTGMAAPPLRLRGSPPCVLADNQRTTTCCACSHADAAAVRRCVGDQDQDRQD